MAAFAIALLFTLTLLAGTGTIVVMMVWRWDAILAALAGEPIPERRFVPVVSRMARMRAPARAFRPGPTRRQLLRAAA